MPNNLNPLIGNNKTPININTPIQLAKDNLKTLDPLVQRQIEDLMKQNNEMKQRYEDA